MIKLKTLILLNVHNLGRIVEGGQLRIERNGINKYLEAEL